MGMELKVMVGYTHPVKDVLMNPFRFFQDSSSNASPETLMPSKNKRIDRIVQTFPEDVFREMLSTKSTAARLAPGAQLDTGND